MVANLYKPTLLRFSPVVLVDDAGIRLVGLCFGDGLEAEPVLIVVEGLFDDLGVLLENAQVGESGNVVGCIEGRRRRRRR